MSGTTLSRQAASPVRVAPANGAVRGRMEEIQRGRLLAAMVAECAQRGAGSVSVAHVVARAGVSRRTFYELFPDREACFLAAFGDAMTRATHDVLQDHDPSASWEARIRALLVGLLWFLQAERELGQLLVVGSLGAGPRVLERRREVLACAIAVVDEGRARVKAGAEPPTLAAEGIVGGVLSVLYARLSDQRTDGLIELLGPLMSMIVLPYRGPTAARRELDKPAPARDVPAARGRVDPLSDLPPRLTYRTVRVLLAVAAHQGASNREVAVAAGIADQGQISKLLARLEKIGLVSNRESSPGRGAPNAWVLTPQGRAVERALGGDRTQGEDERTSEERVDPGAG